MEYLLTLLLIQLSDILGMLPLREIIMLLLGAGLTYLVARKIITSQVKGSLMSLAKVIKEARAMTSEGGKEITKAEMAVIIKMILGVVEDLLHQFGIKVDLDGDGK